MSLSAEFSTLGCIFHEPALLNETTLQPENFGDDRTQVIFGAMRSVQKRGDVPDLPFVAMELGRKLDFVGGFQFLDQLRSTVYTSDTKRFERYEQVVFDAWKNRKALQLAEELKRQGDAKDGIAWLSEQITQIEQAGHKHKSSKQDTLVGLSEKIDNRDGSIIGCSTGYNSLDKVTFGYRPGQLIIIGARPAMGKTAYALCKSINAAKAGTCVTFFSLEMDSEELYERAIASIGHLSFDKLRNPKKKFSETDWTKKSVAIATLERAPLEVESRFRKFQDIYATMRQRMRQFPNMKHLCVIDYLQLIKIGGFRGSRYEEVSEVSGALKRMALDLRIPVVALSQVSRDIDNRTDKRPLLSDLRESGSIEQDADIVQFLYRPGYYYPDKHDLKETELNIAKQRGGRLATLPMEFYGEYTLMEDKN